MHSGSDNICLFNITCIVIIIIIIIIIIMKKILKHHLLWSMIHVFRVDTFREGNSIRIILSP